MFDAITAISPPQRLSLIYLEEELRPLLTLFLALDMKIEDILLKMNEVMIAQIRLAWWRDMINSEVKAKGEPLVEMIGNVQNQYPNIDVTNTLISLINGWEYLIIDEKYLSDKKLHDYANERGGALFNLIAIACGKIELCEEYRSLGCIWALSFLFNLDDEKSVRAKALANEYYNSIDYRKLSRLIRSLSLLAFPAIHALKTNHKKQDGISFGLSYVWHAISAR